MEGPAPAARPRPADAVAVPLATTVGNIASYALLLAAAHLMTKDDYGELSSLLGVLLISTVPMFALQTVAGRRAATGIATSASLVPGTAAVALAATGVLALLSPALAIFLHLASPVGVLLVAATVPGTAVLGTAMGVAQGHRHFRRLAWLILLTIGGRSTGGLVGLLLYRTTTSTLIGLVVGTSAAAAAVALAGDGAARHRAALRAPAWRERAESSAATARGVVTETLHAAHAHGLFLLLTSLDVLLARHVLTSAEAGLYAVGSVITRAALWLPQSLVLLLFAGLAEGAERAPGTARRAVAVVGGLGVLTVAVTLGLGRVAVTIVGGAKYHALDEEAWLFALLGSLLALVQLGVLAGLAQRRVRRTLLLWVTIATDVVLVLATSDEMTPQRLVLTLALVTAGAAAAAVLLTLRQDVAPDGQAGATKAGSSPTPKLPVTPDGTG